MPEEPTAARKPPESERVFRETILRRFEDPEHSEILRRFGALLYALAVESELWGAAPARGVLAVQVAAAAEDLEHLAGYLREVAQTPTHTGVSEEELTLCRRAAEWAEHLARAVDGLRRAAEGSGSRG